jgi:RNA polymerase sigma-70 factor (ECF subfamily)
MEIPIAETQILTMLSEEQRRIVETALERLPDHQRVPLVLYHFEDLDYADIAGELGISVSKVKTDIFRGREALRKKLQPTRADLGF